MFKKIYSLSLLVLVLFVSTGFSVSGHFCQGKLKSLGFYSDAEVCSGMENNTCLANQHEQGYSNKCCTSLRFVNMVNAFEISNFTIGQQTQNDFQFLYFPTAVLNINQSFATIVKVCEDPPPNLDLPDLQVLHQVFLI